MARKNKIDTKLEIIEVATRLFLERGYTNVMIADIAQELSISKGNLAFHFRTKEHLLAELIKMLCDFQWKMMEKDIMTGHSALIAYLFEITSAASICWEDAVARNLYVSAYISPLPLQLIRESDTKKVKNIFAEYCPQWEDADFMLAENIASGIEYSMFTGTNMTVPFPQMLARSLDTILLLYHVPDEVREKAIHEVLSMDYSQMGRRMLQEFTKYVAEVNRQNLADAVARKAQKRMLQQARSGKMELKKPAEQSEK